MTNFNNSNFYMDNESLKSLEDDYTKSIDNLKKLYLDLENKINNIESEEKWKGKSFSSFKRDFDEWKLKYLASLAQLIELKNFVKNVIGESELLINERDSLKKSLEV